MFDSKINRFLFIWGTGIFAILFCFGLMIFSSQSMNIAWGSGIPQEDNPFADIDDNSNADNEDSFDFDSMADEKNEMSTSPVQTSSAEDNKNKFSNDESEMTSPFASSEVQSKPNPSPVTVVLKNGVLVFEGEIKEKKLSEMTEEDFYQSLTSAEKVILTKKPQTAPELIEAAAMIARTGRPEFAKVLVEKSLTANGTPEEFAQMIDRVGSDRILFLVANPMIGSQGAAAANLAMTEAQKYWESPEFIQNGMDKALSGNNPERAAALIDLRKAGDVAIQKILQMLLSDQPQESERANTLLTLMGDPAVEALIISLRTDNSAHLAQIAQTLGTLRHIDIVPALLSRYYVSNSFDETAKSAIESALISQCSVIPTREEAVEQLRQKTSAYFNRTQTLPIHSEQIVSLWIWDEVSQKPVRQEFSEEAAYRFLAVQYALQTVAIQNVPELLNSESYNNDFLLAVVCAAEKVVYDSGLDAEPDLDAFGKIIPEINASQLNAALELALQKKHMKGGIIPALLLAKMGDESFCYRMNKPAVIVQAATCSDRRLRYAALKTIVQWNPQRSYIGSGRVWESLVQLTSANGTRKIIVAMSKIEDIMRVGNYFISQTPHDFSDSATENDQEINQNSINESDSSDLQADLAQQADSTTELAKSSDIAKENDNKNAEENVDKNDNEKNSGNNIGKTSENQNESSDPLKEAKTKIASDKSETPKQTTSLSEALTSYKETFEAQQPVEKLPDFKLNLATENGFVPSEDFQIIPAVDGNDIISIAKNNADVEFIVATSYIKTPDLRVVSQTLQKDYRTSDIPILIGYEEEARSLWAHEYGMDEPNAIVLPLPYDSESGQWAIRNLYKKTNPEQVPVDLRLQQSKWAGQTLVQLYASRVNVYQPEDIDILARQMVLSPLFFNEGLALAEIIATNKTQNFLIELIGDTRLDLAVRYQILNAFRQNLQTNGSLLRGPDIIKMYDRYNASEAEDQEIQKLLSQMLDAYEAVKK